MTTFCRHPERVAKRWLKFQDILAYDRLFEDVARYTRRNPEAWTVLTSFVSLRFYYIYNYTN